MGYAILWTLIAIGVMLMANKKRLANYARQLWLLGAALLGLNLVKLMLIDLSHVHSVERMSLLLGLVY